MILISQPQFLNKFFSSFCFNKMNSLYNSMFKQYIYNCLTICMIKGIPVVDIISPLTCRLNYPSAHLWFWHFHNPNLLPTPCSLSLSLSFLRWSERQAVCCLSLTLHLCLIECYTWLPLFWPASWPSPFSKTCVLPLQVKIPCWEWGL